MAAVRRDRAGAYAEADRRRWLQNRTEAAQRAVAQPYPRLREIARQTAAEAARKQEPSPEPTDVTMVALAPAEQLRQTRQERRQARCAEALQRREQGTSIQSMARQLRLPRRLVRQLIRLGAAAHP